MILFSVILLWSDSLNYYKNMIFSNPYSAEYKEKFLNYGIAQYHLGRYNAAMKSLENAYPYLSRNEKAVDIFWKALTLYKQKKYTSAFTMMKKIQNRYSTAKFWEGIIKSREHPKEGMEMMKMGLDSTNEYESIVYIFNLLRLDPKLASKYLSSKNIQDNRLLNIGKGFYYLENNLSGKALKVFMKIKNKDDYVICGMVSAYLLKRNYEKAFNIIKKQKIKNPEMDVYLGESAYGVRNYPLAESVFTRLKNYPEWAPKAFYGLGWTFYQTQSYKKAVKSFKKFLETKQKKKIMEYAIYRIGRAYLKIGDTENGLSYMKEIVKNYPNSSLYDDALFLLGKINLVLDNFKIAKEYFLKMVVDSPDSRWIPYAYKYVGDIYVREKNYKKGINYYKMAMLDAASPILTDEIKYLVEILKYKAGIYKTLIQAKKSFVNLYPESEKVPSVLLEIGDFYYAGGRLRKAIHYYKTVYEKYKEDEICGESLLKLSRALREMKKQKKAISYLEELSKREGYFALAHKIIGDIYYDDEIFQKAVDEYVKVVEDKNNIFSEYAQLRITNAYMNLGLFREARVALTKFIRDYPNSNNLLRVYKKLANTYYQEGMFEDYINILEQGADKFTGKERGDFFLLMARAYCQLNDTNAISYYLSAAQLFGTLRLKAANALKEGAKCASQLNLPEKSQELEDAAQALLSGIDSEKTEESDTTKTLPAKNKVKSKKLKGKEN